MVASANIGPVPHTIQWALDCGAPALSPLESTGKATCRIEAIPREINALLDIDITAKAIVTARQAFAAQHPEAFPTSLTTYHLLDFDDKDITAWIGLR